MTPHHGLPPPLSLNPLLHKRSRSIKCNCEAKYTISYFNSQMLLYLYNCPHIESDADLYHHYGFKVNNLTQLDLISCSSLLKFTTFTKLVELDLRECTNLQSIESMPVLQNLNISQCFNLSSMGDFYPQLQMLKASDCHNLITLPSVCPSLSILNVGNCYKLDSIPYYPQIVDMYGCDLWELKYMPIELYHLKYLTLINAPKIQYLPESHRLKELSLHGASINKLPSYPNCTDIQLFNVNIKDDTLTCFHDLKNLTLDKCNISKLMGNQFPRLLVLLINECHNLNTIPMFRLVRELEIKECNNLISIQSQKHLEQLKVTNCPRLQEIHRQDWILELADHMLYMLEGDLDSYIYIKNCPLLYIGERRREHFLWMQYYNKNLIIIQRFIMKLKNRIIKKRLEKYIARVCVDMIMKYL